MDENAEVVNLDSQRKAKKKARDKKIFRYVLLPIIAIVAVFAVMEIVNPTPNLENAPLYDSAEIAVAEEYKVKAIANIDVIVAAHHCDDLITEINIAANLQSGKGPSAWANQYIYNYAYSSAVTLGCDMKDALRI